MNRSDQQAKLGVLWALSICLLAGCFGENGPFKVPITGTVEFQGEPIPAGTIAFAPVDPDQGKPMSIEITAGQFATPPGQGLIAGRYKVVVISTALYSPGADPATDAPLKKAIAIPSVYGRPDTSDLEITISTDDRKIEKQFVLNHGTSRNENIR
ncbi:hypothetical protein M4951_14555 [Blastopirellula sp. J2-11]|uniref:hypothetical protein n=1 Tax=Blastopirellula sp. J2-11 TaxID=2943192 RepID=UPI0021CAC05C|nr:hypothetical protein [Blastopirellula sp. J2-11]UUO04611.1 hypothetical protein M4951_14555 [Blastopirellula sp. J2-11]